MIRHEDQKNDKKNDHKNKNNTSNSGYMPGFDENSFENKPCSNPFKHVRRFEDSNFSEYKGDLSHESGYNDKTINEEPERKDPFVKPNNLNISTLSKKPEKPIIKDKSKEEKRPDRMFEESFTKTGLKEDKRDYTEKPIKNYTADESDTSEHTSDDKDKSMSPLAKGTIAVGVTATLAAVAYGVTEGEISGETKKDAIKPAETIKPTPFEKTSKTEVKIDETKKKINSSKKKSKAKSKASSRSKSPSKSKQKK
jgi:hypothetical protein